MPWLHQPFCAELAMTHSTICGCVAPRPTPASIASIQSSQPWPVCARMAASACMGCATQSCLASSRSVAASGASVADAADAAVPASPFAPSRASPPPSSSARRASVSSSRARVLVPTASETCASDPTSHPLVALTLPSEATIAASQVTASRAPPANRCQSFTPSAHLSEGNLTGSDGERRAPR
ncbi:hypothetical protein ACFPRL_22535 [Pseudoclavibacter helvolus]